MTAQTGRTHAKWLTVKIDNNAGTLTDISAYTNTISAFGLKYDTQDVTAFSDFVKNVVVGQPGAPLTIGGPLDTVMVTHGAAINGTGTPMSVSLQIGIRHAWESGEPTFGVTSSSTSGYLCSEFTVDPKANTWNIALDMFGPTAPSFATTAFT